MPTRVQNRGVSSLSADSALWLGFYVLVLAAWGALALMAAAEAGRFATPIGALDFSTAAALWRELCLVAAGDTGLGALTAMWALMAVAMMAPAAVPMLSTYRALTDNRRADRPALSFWALFAGYLFVWIGFSVIAAGAQQGLAGAGLLGPGGVSISDGLSALLLIGAGLYQFSALKEACLQHCRTPMAFYMARWRNGPGGALRMGLAQGAACLGCCWALMLLGFVGGTMNLVWMAGAAILMTLEKLPAIGRRLTGPLGLALIAAGLAVAARGFGLIQGGLT